MKTQFPPLTSQLPSVQKHEPNHQLSPTATETDRVLCAHCQRTATNGNPCKWICKRDRVDKSLAN